MTLIRVAPGPTVARGVALECGETGCPGVGPWAQGIEGGITEKQHLLPCHSAREAGALGPPSAPHICIWGLWVGGRVRSEARELNSSRREVGKEEGEYPHFLGLP